MFHISLKYVGTSVVFQEVPDEITLAFSISGCPYLCPGCHSPYLREDTGRDLGKFFASEIEKHPGITCVCFMGGDADAEKLLPLCEVAHLLKLKTCFYSGSDDWEEYLSAFPQNRWLDALDYLKTGSWKEELGPLGSEHTNQRMYRITGPRGKRAAEDITQRFVKTYE